MNRTPFVLAAIAAGLTSLYWTALALLMGITGGPAQVIVPIILIVLYAYRGLQVFQGVPTAANALLFLHGIGTIVSVMRMLGGDSIVVLLYGIKIALHVFGAATAFWATRAAASPTL